MKLYDGQGILARENCQEEGGVIQLGKDEKAGEETPSVALGDSSLGEGA